MKKKSFNLISLICLLTFVFSCTEKEVITSAVDFTGDNLVLTYSKAPLNGGNVLVTFVGDEIMLTVNDAIPGLKSLEFPLYKFTGTTADCSFDIEGDIKGIYCAGTIEKGICAIDVFREIPQTIITKNWHSRGAPSNQKQTLSMKWESTAEGLYIPTIFDKPVPVQEVVTIANEKMPKMFYSTISQIGFQRDANMIIKYTLDKGENWVFSDQNMFFYSVDSSESMTIFLSKNLFYNDTYVPTERMEVLFEMLFTEGIPVKYKATSDDVIITIEKDFVLKISEYIPEIINALDNVLDKEQKEILKGMMPYLNDCIDKTTEISFDIRLFSNK